MELRCESLASLSYFLHGPAEKVGDIVQVFVIWPGGNCFLIIDPWALSPDIPVVASQRLSGTPKPPKFSGCFTRGGRA